MKQKDVFSIKFYGVRGSYPNPTKDKLKYGGNTSCIVIQINEHIVIIDAGTGIISLGDELLKEYIASGTNNNDREQIQLTMLFSHTHHDHIQGFPFFKPAFIGTSLLHMFGAKSLNINFEETLTNSMFTPFFPVDLGEMAAQMDIRNFKETEMLLLYPGKCKPKHLNIYKHQESIPDDVAKITCLKSYAHPKDGVLIFRIDWKGKSLVYASDKESYIGGDGRLAAFAQNADVLIHDTQYTQEDYSNPMAPKQGYGHSTPEMAVETCKAANAKKLVMFHYDPSYNDKAIASIEEKTRKLFPETYASYEGMEINLLNE